MEKQQNDDYIKRLDSVDDDLKASIQTLKDSESLILKQLEGLDFHDRDLETQYFQVSQLHTNQEVNYEERVRQQAVLENKLILGRLEDQIEHMQSLIKTNDALWRSLKNEEDNLSQELLMKQQQVKTRVVDGGINEEQWKTERVQVLQSVQENSRKEEEVFIEVCELVSELQTLEEERAMLSQSENQTKSLLQDLQTEREYQRKQFELQITIDELKTDVLQSHLKLSKHQELICMCHGILRESATEMKRGSGFVKYEACFKHVEDVVDQLGLQVKAFIKMASKVKPIKSEDSLKHLKHLLVKGKEHLQAFEGQQDSLQLDQSLRDFAATVNHLYLKKYQDYGDSVRIHDQHVSQYAASSTVSANGCTKKNNTLVEDQLYYLANCDLQQQALIMSEEQASQAMQMNQDLNIIVNNKLSLQDEEITQVEILLKTLMTSKVIRAYEDLEGTSQFGTLSIMVQELKLENHRQHLKYDQLTALQISYFSFSDQSSNVLCLLLTENSQALEALIARDIRVQIVDLKHVLTSRISHFKEKRTLITQIRQTVHVKKSELQSMEDLKQAGEVSNLRSKLEEAYDLVHNQVAVVIVSLEELRQILEGLKTMQIYDSLVTFHMKNNDSLSCNGLDSEDNQQMLIDQEVLKYRTEKLKAKALSKLRQIEKLLNSDTDPALASLRELLNQERQLFDSLHERNDSQTLEKDLLLSLERMAQIEKEISRQKEVNIRNQEEVRVKDELMSKMRESRSHNINPLKEKLSQNLEKAEKMIQVIEKLAKHGCNDQVDPKIDRILEKLRVLQNECTDIKTQVEDPQWGDDTICNENSSEQIETIIAHNKEAENMFGNLLLTSDNILRSLKKLRFKLGDLEIPERVASRKQQMKHINQILKDTQKEVIDADTIPGCTSEGFKGNVQKLQTQISQDLGLFDLRLKNLENKIFSVKDLTQEGPTFLIPLSQELNDIGSSMTQRQTDIENIHSQLQYMADKHKTQTLEKRHGHILEEAREQRSRIKDMQEVTDTIEELCEEFQGCCSDDEELTLIDRTANLDVKELHYLLRQVLQANDELLEKLKVQEMRIHEGKDLDHKSVQNDLEDLETISKKHTKEVTKVDIRVKKLMAKFDHLNGLTKLKLREREIDEIERRLGQIDTLIQKIEEETQDSIKTMQQNDDPQRSKIIFEMRDLSHKLRELRDSQHEQLVKNLNEVRVQLIQSQSRSQNNMKNSDILKEAKRLKRNILVILKQARQLKQEFGHLRSLFEGCKLKLKTIPQYKPLVGDDVDKMIADWIYANCCPIPISRLGNGYYQFGQKKIYAKITNDKLVIRVGGGYMGIDEFMYYYGAQELNKMLVYEGINIDDDIDLDKLIHQKQEGRVINKFDDGTTVVGSAQMKSRLSPSSSVRNIGNRSPRIGKKPSPIRPQTPSITTMLKHSLRRGSICSSSPKSIKSQQQRSTGLTDTIQSTKQQSVTSLIKGTISPSNVQGRKSPLPFTKLDNNKALKTPQTTYALAGEMAGYLTVPTQHDNLSSYDSYLKQGRVQSRQDTQSVSAYDDLSDEPKSKILDLIKERKALQKSKNLRK